MTVSASNALFAIFLEEKSFYFFYFFLKKILEKFVYFFKVSIFVTQCFAAAAQFEQCREKIATQLLGFIKDLLRCLQFKNLARLCLEAAECVSAFASHLKLQHLLYESGVLVHLLFYMFNYDFTLEEGGVERSGESNQQEIANRLAIVALKACARLAGFNGSLNGSKTR